MKLSRRLERLAARVQPRPCPACGGSGGPAVFADVRPGEGTPTAPPCPGCGVRPMLIEVVRPDGGWPAGRGDVVGLLARRGAERPRLGLGRMAGALRSLRRQQGGLTGR
jgi:hypothetical protein